MRSIIRQMAGYWQPVWDHRRFVAYSWALMAWLVSTLAAFTKMSHPQFLDSLPLAVTALALLIYRYLPSQRMRFRLPSRWYFILWTLFVVSGVGAENHLWWQSLLAVLSIPILSHWLDELLQHSQGQTALLAAIWAFSCLFERATDLTPAVLWGFIFLPMLAAVVLTLLSIFWPSWSKPQTYSHSKREDALTSVQMIPFAVAGIILVVTQIFLAILAHFPFAGPPQHYELGSWTVIGVLIMLPLASDSAEALMLYLSITLSGVAIMLLEARSAVWLGFPFFHLARDFIIFWWTAALIRLRQPHRPFIPIVVTASIFLAVIGREIGVWWLNSFQKFPVEEWSGIVLFLIVPSTIHYVFGKGSHEATHRNAAGSYIPDTAKASGIDFTPEPIEDVEAWAKSVSLHLTPQELRICEALLLGMSHAQIAAALYISPNTLKTHLHNIYHKTGVKNRFELVTLIGQGKISASSPLSRT